MPSHSISDLAAQLGRANVHNADAHRLVLHRILGERDRLHAADEHLAGCVHAAAVLVRSMPNLEPDLALQLQSLTVDLLHGVAGVATEDPSPTPGGDDSLNEMLLGGVMVQLGLVTEQDVSDALAEMVNTKQRLGEVLIRLGRATREDVANAVGLQVAMRDTSGPTGP